MGMGKSVVTLPLLQGRQLAPPLCPNFSFPGSAREHRVTTRLLASETAVILLHYGGKDAWEKLLKCNSYPECQKKTENNYSGHKIRSVKKIGGPAEWRGG